MDPSGCNTNKAIAVCVFGADLSASGLRSSSRGCERPVLTLMASVLDGAWIHAENEGDLFADRHARATLAVVSGKLLGWGYGA